MAQNIEDKIRELIADRFGIDDYEISRSSSFTDLGADSLDAVELLMDVEEEYGFMIPDDDANDIHTVGELISYVERRL